MVCPVCQQQLIRVKHEESETQDKDIFACITKKCSKFTGFDLGNPQNTIEVITSK